MLKMLLQLYSHPKLKKELSYNDNSNNHGWRNNSLNSVIIVKCIFSIRVQKITITITARHCAWLRAITHARIDGTNIDGVSIYHWTAVYVCINNATRLIVWWTKCLGLATFTHGRGCKGCMYVFVFLFFLFFCFFVCLFFCSFVCLFVCLFVCVACICSAFNDVFNPPTSNFLLETSNSFDCQ